MQRPWPATGMRTNRPLQLALGAVLAAASAFVLPALDVDLPGGALGWQLAALVVAAASAGWAYGGTKAPAGQGGGSRRGLVRLLAVVAVLLALAWIGGVAVLWVIWPR